ncbi:MAG: DUF2306 domain-containing protein [Parvularculaceae bacterium]
MLEYLTSWTDDMLGAAHLAAALTALFAGAMVVVLKKGTRLHVATGYIYILAMLAVNASALSKYDLTGAPNLFHFFAVCSLATLIAGYSAALAFRRSRRISAAAAHGALMLWSYFGLVIALIAEIFTRAVPFMLHGEGGFTRFAMALGLFMLAGGWLMNRFISREIARTLRN